MVNIIIIGIQEYFKEFGRAIENAVHQMGYMDTQIHYYLKKSIEKGSQKVIFSKECNIVCAPQQIDEEFILPKNNSIKILIHTEQTIKHISYEKWDRVLTLFKDMADETPMIYFPCGYSSCFINMKENKSTVHHKLYSFGAYTNYRRGVCKKFDIYHDLSISGDRRGTTIRKAEININLKAFKERYYFAPLHALLVICQGKLLFQQKSDGDYSIYAPYIIEFDESSFIAKKDYYLMHENERDELGKSYYNALRENVDFNYNFSECVKTIL